jgi:hypothetical protein
VACIKFHENVTDRIWIHNKLSTFFLHSSTDLFISGAKYSHAFCFLVLLKCSGCFGSHIIGFFRMPIDKLYHCSLTPVWQQRSSPHISRADWVQVQGYQPQLLFRVMLKFYGRKELLWEASFGFAFLWTTKNHGLVAWLQQINHLLHGPHAVTDKRITAQTTGSGTVPKNCEWWWMKLIKYTILNECALASNCISKFQQIIHIPHCHSLCVSVGVPLDTWIN